MAMEIEPFGNQEQSSNLAVADVRGINAGVPSLPPPPMNPQQIVAVRTDVVERSITSYAGTPHSSPVQSSGAQSSAEEGLRHEIHHLRVQAGMMEENLAAWYSARQKKR